MRSGFATLVGRPNVGKSTLLNRILGQKVSIVSDKAQTTRTQVRGVMTRPDVQVVFVDTPGIHKPRTLLGERLNETAANAANGVDVVVFTVDATAPVGTGDRFVAGLVPRDSLCVVNKIDQASPQQVLAQLRRAGEMGFAAYHPVSAVTGQGVDDMVAAIVERMPLGPKLYPDDMVTDVPEAFWVAELVREQLLHVTKDEVPHSVACRVTEWEWPEPRPGPERPSRAGGGGPRIRCEILVERDSQKGIVIGKGGAVLKAVGIAVREQLPTGSYLELFVKVDKDWQRRPQALTRLGY